MADRVLRAVSRHPFLVCGAIGFLAGGTLDIDHIPSWLYHAKYWVPLTIGVPSASYLGQGRNLHGIALAGGGLMCAFAGGYLLFLVLEDYATAVLSRINRSIKELFQTEKPAE